MASILLVLILRISPMKIKVSNIPSKIITPVQIFRTACYMFLRMFYWQATLLLFGPPFEYALKHLTLGFS
jgi:hypothetical protein